jgi:beta-RFAP synthase
MAVAAALARLVERDDWGPEELASLVGRGERSAIGAHGFFRGGFIVEGGKPAAEPGAASGLSPLLMRHAFPEAWRIVLVRPRALEGIAGERERAALAAMPSIPEEATARMSRLVLLGLAPALVERDLDTFGEALYELQQIVGNCFAAAQGGVYAHPLPQEIAGFLRGMGVRGVGQSSWGPTLYAITGDEESAEAVANRVEARFGLSQRGEVMITSGDNRGASVRRLEAPSSTERR